MGLSAQVVYFCRFGCVDDVHQAVAVNQVPVVEDHLPLEKVSSVKKCPQIKNVYYFNFYKVMNVLQNFIYFNK